MLFSTRARGALKHHEPLFDLPAVHATWVLIVDRITIPTRSRNVQEIKIWARTDPVSYTSRGCRQLDARTFVKEAQRRDGIPLADLTLDRLADFPDALWRWQPAK